MAQVISQAGLAESDGVFEFISRPNCSLTHAQQQRVFWGLAGVCFGIASAFAAMGYWLVLPFAGLEIGLLAWAFEAIRARESDFESVTIRGDTLILEWHDGKRCGRREMNRHWAMVICHCRRSGRCRVSLRSHGKETELGQFLSDEGRLALAQTLRRQLLQ
jgi:uncharacterized membrane protein